MGIEVHRLDESRRADFYRLHSAANDHNWCFCIAWWLESFEGWDQRTAEQNRALRESVMDRGDWDGYLLYADGEPAAWCQCCLRSKLGHLERRMKLSPDPEAWVMSCFFVAPAFRGRGLARALVHSALADLRVKGVKRVEAYPKRGEGLPADEAWTGPESLFVSLGFTLVREDERISAYGIELS